MMDTYSLPSPKTRMPPPFWANAGSGTARIDPWSRSCEPTANSEITLRGLWPMAQSAKQNFVVTIRGDAETKAAPSWGSNYLAILEVLKKLALGDDHDEVVEGGAILQACRVLAVLIEGRWPAPRIHWHGGDAIVLSWTRGMRDILLTVTDEGQSLLIMKGAAVEDRRGSVELGDLESVVRPHIERNCFYAYTRY